MYGLKRFSKYKYNKKEEEKMLLYVGGRSAVWQAITAVER